MKNPYVYCPAIGVATVVGTAVAAPIVIPLAVQAVGFSSGGIVAGSAAATAMSKGLAFVPVLQSIGATGAISTATTGLVSTVAGGATGAIAAIASRIKANKPEIDNRNHRPCYTCGHNHQQWFLLIYYYFITTDHNLIDII